MLSPHKSMQNAGYFEARWRRLPEQAETFYRRGPIYWLEALLEYTQSNIAVLRSEHDEALFHGRRAVELAEESGAAVSLRTCLASLSVVFYALGRFDDAVTSLSRGMSILPTTGDIRCGMIDTLTRIRLAEGNVEQCASLLDDAIDSSSDVTDRFLYGRRYLSLTRSQVLGRSGGTTEKLCHRSTTHCRSHANLRTNCLGSRRPVDEISTASRITQRS